jgi:hypothetical protein
LLTYLRFHPHRFNKWLAVALLVISLNLVLLPLNALPALAAEPQFVKVQGDQFYLNGQSILLKGSNYYQRNAPWAEMWKQWYGPQVEQEITEGANKLGLNSLRILVPYGATHSWNNDTTGEIDPHYLNELQQMVQIAGKHGLRVILTLFDFYDEWPAAGTAEEAANLRYLTTLVNTFRDDDRVLAWDLHNEPDNYNRWQKYKRPEEVIDWLSRMVGATRRLDPNHPITIGLGDYHNYWLKARPDLPQLIDLVDFVSFHAYEAPNLLSQTQELKSKTAKPILLEETGWPTAPNYISRSYNEQDQLWFYQRLVEVMQTEKLAGATQWLLWDLTAGRRLRPTDIADWMGLIRWDGTLKPAGEVYASISAPRLPATVNTDLPLTGIPLNEAEKPLYFPETNHYVASYFKQLFLQQGGVDIFGLPLTEPFTENAHTIQFFERAVMELWLEGRDEPGYNDLPRDEQLRRLVKLRLLGRDIAAQRQFEKTAAFQSDDQHWYFPETGHSLSYGFLYYWHHGGLLQFGYPISEELEEVSATDGQKHTVQYFERARFEYHPEHKGTPYETQLGQLGREEMKRRGWPN